MSNAPLVWNRQSVFGSRLTWPAQWTYLPWQHPTPARATWPLSPATPSLDKGPNRYCNDKVSWSKAWQRAWEGGLTPEAECCERVLMGDEIFIHCTSCNHRVSRTLV